MPNNRSNATRAAETADRSFSSQKYTPTGAVWSSASQIGGYHFANLSGQGQFTALASLATNAQLSRFPVNIAEF